MQFCEKIIKNFLKNLIPIKKIIYELGIIIETNVLEIL